MANFFSKTIKELVELIKELIAVWHYISDILAILEVVNLISTHGTYEGLILWIVSAMVSGVIAEVFESVIPTPLRVILKELT